MKPRFFFLEPSKAGSQHITLLQGCLQAISENEYLRRRYEMCLRISKSTEANISNTLTKQYDVKNIPVIHPEKRRLILKTVLEFFVVLYYLIKIRSGDVLFISCLLPTSLLLIELFNKVYRKKGAHVLLHGEIEGIFEKNSESFFKIGFWALKWYGVRNKRSLINLVVLDDFIKSKLVTELDNSVREENVSVIHHPLVPFDLKGNKKEVDLPSVCFIGYKTSFKGFDIFQYLANNLEGYEFIVIGGGKIENLTTNSVQNLDSTESYLEYIAGCTIALFPYTYRYDCSLSAAALDALAAGTYIVASARPFFVNLNKYFGDDIVSIYHSDLDLEKLLEIVDQSKIHFNRGARLESVKKSKFSITAVGESFETMVRNYELNFK